MPPSRIRTHNPSKQEAAVPRLRPRGHWHLLYNTKRKNPFPTFHKKHCIGVTHTSWLMMLRKIIAVYYENRMNHKYTVWGKIRLFSLLKQDIYIYIVTILISLTMPHVQVCSHDNGRPLPLPCIQLRQTQNHRSAVYICTNATNPCLPHQ
jgi:hypothetical protein